MGEASSFPELQGVGYKHHSYPSQPPQASLMVNFPPEKKQQPVDSQNSFCQDCHNRRKGFLALWMVPCEDLGRLRNNKSLQKLETH